MIAILTSYLGPTNHRGARIVAKAANGHRVYIPYPHESDEEDAHRQAAQALCDKMQWKWRMVAGGTKEGYAFVFLED